MENNEFKKVLNKDRTCYYFDDIIQLEDFDFNILIVKNAHENILIYDVSYTNRPKPLRIRFVKIEGFTRVYDGTRYLTLFGSEKYDAIYNRIRYLISLKSGITYFLSLFCKYQS